MNSFLSAKLLWGILSISSVVGVVGTLVKDQEMNSTVFMNDNEIQIERNFEDYDADRDVASLNKGESFTIPRIPKNNKNTKDIDGIWEITRITNDSEVVVYDTYRPEDKKTIIELPLNLIGTSEVRIDKDQDLSFYILFLHETKKTISLIRPFGKGYEIVEAKRTVLGSQFNPYRKTNKSVTKFNTKVAKLDKDIDVKKDDVLNMSLEKVIFPSKTNKVLKGASVDGSVNIKHKIMDDLDFNITFKNLKGVEENFHVSQSTVKVEDGGMFHFEHNGKIISGILTQNGKAGYRIRFVTGDLQGASLNFVTEVEALRISDLKDDMPYDYENIGQDRTDSNIAKEDQEVDEVEAVEQDEASYDRKVSQLEISGGEYGDYSRESEYNDTEKMEDNDNSSEESYSKEQVNNEIESAGFDFAA